MKVKWGNIIILVSLLSYFWIIPECVRTGIYNGIILLPVVIILLVILSRCMFDFPNFDDWDIKDITDGKPR